MPKKIAGTESGKRITYQFTVTFEDESEKVFDIKDDGWQIRIEFCGSHVESLSFGEWRLPKKDSESDRHLEAWAWKKYGPGFHTWQAECGHILCVGCSGHVEYSDVIAHEDADPDDYVHSCMCCHDCGKPAGH